MKTVELQDLKITLDRDGSRKYAKLSCPRRYGCFTEIDYHGFRFQFNRNGEIKYISGTGPDWPHPAEWLKRTMANDWVYYSTGSYYNGVVDLFGEYYLPCPAYPTNSLFREKPFARRAVAAAFVELPRLCRDLAGLAGNMAGPGDRRLRDFLSRAGRNSPAQLRKRAERLHSILKARISVLPPDCRHVDYDVIPLIINQGCLYNCSFCEVKTGMDLAGRSRRDIEAQLAALREFFGADLVNYNSVYLGQHDGLAADPGDIIYAAERAYKVLEIEKSPMQEPRLFLFGSAESFLNQVEAFWKSLSGLPFYNYINIGLESFDDETLRSLCKPVSAVIMKEAFDRLLRMNGSYENIEITANLLIGEELPPNHVAALASHLQGALPKTAGKGCLYISPLKGSRDRKKLLEQFRTIKQQSRIPAFLYLIQRL